MDKCTTLTGGTLAGAPVKVAKSLQRVMSGIFEKGGVLSGSPSKSSPRSSESGGLVRGGSGGSAGRGSMDGIAAGAGGAGAGGGGLGGSGSGVGLSGLGGGGRTRGSNDGLNAMTFSNPVAAPGGMGGMTPVKEVSEKKETGVTLAGGAK